MSAPAATKAGHACPSCAQPMRRQSFERRLQGTVELDICFECHSIWLDRFESTALTPGATIELFKLIEDAAGNARPVASSARCPLCRSTLRLTNDMQRSNRFAYHRCPQGHGRLTTFFQFLREKELVRSLTQREIERLRVTMQQVRCSSCGGAIDIARDAACRYCGTPLAILDAGAVKRTLAELSEAERRRQVVDPVAAMDALLEGKLVERRLERLERQTQATGLDLVHEALRQLLKD